MRFHAFVFLLDKDETEARGEVLSSPISINVSKEDALSNRLSNLYFTKPSQQVELPRNYIDFSEDVSCSNSSEEDEIDDSNEQGSLSYHSLLVENNPEDGAKETLRKSATRSVSFVVADNSEDSKQVRKLSHAKSAPRRRLSDRRSGSPVNVTSKVVPLLDVPSNDGSRGKRLHPNSALKIYALAKTRRKTAGCRLLYSRPPVKLDGYLKHDTSEVSTDLDFLLNDGMDRDISTTFVDTRGYDMMSKTVASGQDGNVTRDTVRYKKRQKEKKDLMSWCLNALSEKAKYPILSSKPKLRSRRSILTDKGKVYYHQRDVVSCCI